MPVINLTSYWKSNKKKKSSRDKSEVEYQEVRANTVKVKSLITVTKSTGVLTDHSHCA